MKTDTAKLLNSILAYARDNLMLDALDETYTMNRLAAIAGLDATAVDLDAEYGDKTVYELLDELAAVSPKADKLAVIDALMPAPHTVQMYFTDALNRNREKAFDFIFELYAAAGSAADGEATATADGFVRYTQKSLMGARNVIIDGDGDLMYTPRAVGNKIATAEADDILAFDVLRRETAIAENYGFAVAKRIGGTDSYYCCNATALGAAKTKEQLASGAVKIALLDYPVPVLAFSGIAKNSVITAAVRAIRAAEEKNIACVAVSQMAGDALNVYVVFANDVQTNDIITRSDALAVCGVYAGADFAELIKILEKGTALPTDQMAYKAIYDAIGGVKHGAKAVQALDGAVRDIFKKLLAAAASADDGQVKALLEARQADDTARI